MGCYTKQEQERLKAYRAQWNLDKARLANYKPLYLAARAARDYLKDTLQTNNAALVDQLNAALNRSAFKARATGAEVMSEITREQAAALADAICKTAILNMTLRDLFAAFALAGMLARPIVEDDYEATSTAQAADAYYYADLMLAQRSKES